MASLEITKRVEVVCQVPSRNTPVCECAADQIETLVFGDQLGTEKDTKTLNQSSDINIKRYYAFKRSNS